MLGRCGLICSFFFGFSLACTTQSPPRDSHEDQATTPKKPTSSVESQFISQESIAEVSSAKVEAKLKRAEKLKAELEKVCQSQLAKLPKPTNKIDTICQLVEHRPSCISVRKQKIFHFDSKSQRANTSLAKRVLVFAVVHGDEPESGSVALRWMERLLDIESRNSWRILPVLNPDGMDLRTRTNANGVDLNRNFPSEDWDKLAIKWWKEKGKANPRRYPGDSAGSEPETNCAIEHIDDFQPDFIVAVHTPYGVLDFDGPQIQFPNFSNLPWVSLGTFPGSLGRYMWKDQQIPVMTVELKDGKILNEIDKLDTLQDIAGTVAIRSTR